MANVQRGAKSQSQRGDVTGRLSEVLAGEAEDKVNERRAEMGMITHNQRAVKQEGVIDLTGDTPRLEGTDELLDLASIPIVTDEPTPVPAGRNINNGSGATNEVLELPQPVEDPKSSREVLEPGKEMEAVTVQILFELEDITLGQGNTMTLKSGYRYKMPRWQAEHLEHRQVANILTFS